MTALPLLLVGLLFGAAGSDSPPVPVRANGTIEPPRKVKHVDPKYPSDASRAGLAGPVVVECLIDPQGQVVRTDVLEGVPPLAEAAVAAVKKWRYTPTVLDGVATPVIMTVTVNFRLEEVQYRGLLDSLDHSDEHIREAAARNLGRIRGGSGIDEGEVKEGIRALERLAEKDASPRVREAAARSLTRLDGRPLPPGVPAVDPGRTPEGRRVSFGVFVDPALSSKIAESDGRVELDVTPGNLQLSAENGNMTAPRVLRPVEGDFEAEVSVSGLPDLGISPPGTRGTFRGAGLLLWQDEDNYVRLESCAYRVPESASWVPDSARRRRGPTPVGPPVHYALFEVRQNGRLLDGPTRADDLARSLQIGLAAMNVARYGMKVAFEGFRLAPGAEPARVAE